MLANGFNASMPRFQGKALLRSVQPWGKTPPMVAWTSCWTRLPNRAMPVFMMMNEI